MNETQTFDFVAAWLSEACAEHLRAAGVVKTLHMTTFFDAYDQLKAIRSIEGDVALSVDRCENGHHSRYFMLADGRAQSHCR